MKMFLLLSFLLTFSPVAMVFAQDDGYDDYSDDTSGYDSSYDDGYSDDEYYDDEYYDDEYYDDYADDGSGSVVAAAGPKYIHTGLILRGGWQGSVEKTFVQGGIVEAMLNVDVYYVYFQLGVGWSSYWSNFGVEKANGGGAGSARSGMAFNEGMYLGLGLGAVIPQIGLRIGGGIQMSFPLLGHGFNFDYSDEILPYVEIFYELGITDNFLWTVGMRSLLSAARFSDFLPDTGRKATVELQTGFIFNFL